MAKFHNSGLILIKKIPKNLQNWPINCCIISSVDPNFKDKCPVIWFHRMEISILNVSISTKLINSICVLIFFFKRPNYFGWTDQRVLVGTWTQEPGNQEPGRKNLATMVWQLRLTGATCQSSSRGMASLKASSWARPPSGLVL